MATEKSLSIEDRNLFGSSIFGSRNRAYSDIDLSFETKTSGEIYKKTDVAAVKQSVKNIVMTNYFEKPFNPFFGADVRSMLFELVGTMAESDIKRRIKKSINEYEPRAEILDIIANSLEEQNEISVQIQFKVINTDEIVTIRTSISRLR